MSYTRVRPRHSKHTKILKLNNEDNRSDCLIPVSQLKTFIEDNPSATESAQIEAFFGQQMIPEFNECEPNLINTSAEKMAEYKRQRQLIQHLKDLKKQKKRHNSHNTSESSGVHFSHSLSEPFFTVLIRFMSNYKPSKDDIQRNLGHLGTIEDIVVFSDGYDYQMAFVRFESSDVAFDLSLQWKQIKLNYGLAKNVAIRAHPKRALSSGGGYQLWAFMQPIDRQLLVERVRNSLQSGQHFEVMKECLLLKESDRQNRLYLCHKLGTILNNNRIVCKFYIFGSTVNELGFCDSDIDVFIEVKDENNISTKMDTNLAVIYLTQIREVLGKELRMFIRPTIRSRRCPLVKLDFRHFADNLRANGISCDLSLVNSLGIRNSKLIAFYCKLEPLFQTLAVVLRYLAKLNGFIGSSQMSSYAFTMLIIFFCQRLSVPLLPNVKDLMQMKTEQLEINGLDCGFCDDVNHYRQSFPKQWDEASVNHLLGLFFQFYSNFDFRFLVICPRNGVAVHKCNFDSYLKNLRVNNVHEFRMTELICIQDPFDLTFNITHHMPYKLLIELRAWFQKVSALSHEYFDDEPTFDDNRKTFVDLLEPTNKAIEEIKKQMEKDSKTTSNTNEDDNDIEIINRIISKHFIAKLVINFEPNITAEDMDNQLEDWALKVGHFFRMLFREAFNGMKCLYDNKDKSKIKLNEKTTFEAFVLKFKTTDRRIIDEEVRQLAVSQLKESYNDLDFIKRQALITATIVQNSEDCIIIDENADEISIELELSFETNNDLYLNITDIKPRNDSKLTHQLIDFICHTFRSGLESEQLLAIDDDIIAFL